MHVPSLAERMTLPTLMSPMTVGEFTDSLFLLREHPHQSLVRRETAQISPARINIHRLYVQSGKTKKMLKVKILLRCGKDQIIFKGYQKCFSYIINNRIDAERRLKN